MSQATPKVSIGLPVYNGERYLAPALDCLLGQTFADFELIISDNASSDRTAQICQDYAAADQRIQYHRQEENRGAAWNFNQVFHLASGQYFKWAAYDDLCAAEFVEQAVDVLDYDAQVVWCHSRTGTMNESQLEIPSSDDTAAISLLPDDANQPSRQDQHPHRRFHAVLLGSPYCFDSYGLMRSETLKRTRLELPFFGSEKVMLAELSLLGRFHQLDPLLFWTRVHGQASTSLATAQQQQDYVAPGIRGSGWRNRWRLLKGFATAVYRHPLTTAQRIACHTSLARYVLQVGKWKRVLGQIVLSKPIETESVETPAEPDTQRPLQDAQAAVQSRGGAT